ncbi:PSB4-like protein [Mya arenaria]|uniref:PSB4-like protein n=1 Tax=Mya arenaria TaxID=6604 RepID=A0ABY7G8Y3_MYAAR|nr:PSB4-like protein [Mya arenaria]
MAFGSTNSSAMHHEVQLTLKASTSTCQCNVRSGFPTCHQFTQQLITTIIWKGIEEECLNDGFGYTPSSLFSWLTRVMYNRRSNINPLWNTYVWSCIIDGIYACSRFLGYVDKIGVAYQAPTVATGYGAYIAQPLLREAVEKNPNMTSAQAAEIVDNCLRYEVAIITKDGVEIRTPCASKPNWEIAHLIKGYE